MTTPGNPDSTVTPADYELSLNASVSSNDCVNYMKTAGNLNKRVFNEPAPIRSMIINSMAECASINIHYSEIIKNITEATINAIDEGSATISQIENLLLRARVVPPYNDVNAKYYSNVVYNNSMTVDAVQDHLTQQESIKSGHLAKINRISEIVKNEIASDHHKIKNIRRELM